MSQAASAATSTAHGGDIEEGVSNGTLKTVIILIALVFTLGLFFYFRRKDK